MNKRALVRHMAIMVVTGSVAMLSAAPQRADEPAAAKKIIPDGTYSGHSVPSELRAMNFNSPGVVIEVLVKEGDTVKKGQLLAKQDARVEEADKAVQEVEANSDLQIDAAQKTLDENKLELNQDELMLKQKVIGTFEVYKARLEVDIAEARLSLAKQEKSTAALKVKEAEARIAQKRLIATTDGIVQAIGVNEGELTSNDPKNPVVTIVTNDPLFVEANLPPSEVELLQKNQKVQVCYVDKPDVWFPAEVVFTKPVAMASAYSQMVRFQFENPKLLKPAGLNMLVKVRDKVASAPSAR